MKRRHFLNLLPAVPASLALSQGKSIEKESLTAAGFAIAVQCWSLKEFTLFETIDMAAAAGASGVEIFPGQKIGGPVGDVKLGPEIDDTQVQAIMDQLKKHGLTAMNYGVISISKEEVEARKTFEFAKKMGLYGITTEELDALDVLEKLAIEYDLKVCFHNHPKPTRLWNPDTVWAAIKDRHANIGYCADLGHWASSGLDPLEVIKKIAPRVHAFHMKDREAIGKWTHDRPFGTGVIQLMPILDEVRKHGFAGNVSIEYEHNWKTNLPEIAQCVGYLRAYARISR